MSAVEKFFGCNRLATQPNISNAFDVRIWQNLWCGSPPRFLWLVRGAEDDHPQHVPITIDFIHYSHVPFLKSHQRSRPMLLSDGDETKKPNDLSYDIRCYFLFCPDCEVTQLLDFPRIWVLVRILFLVLKAGEVVGRLDGFQMSSFFPLHLPPLSPSRLQPFTFVSQLLSPAILHVSPSSGLRVACNPLHCHWSPCVYMCLPALDCCVRLCLAILYICLPALGCCVRLCLAILYICLAALGCCVPSALQPLILHLSPSSDCCVFSPFALQS